MAKFFVGQRVRIKFSKCWPELAGEEGRIIAIAPKGDATVPDERSDWIVAPDVWATHFAPFPGIHAGHIFAPNSDQLEPLLPSGHQAGDYSFQELMEQCRQGEGVAALRAVSEQGRVTQ